MILYFYTILISCLTLVFIQTTGKTVNNDSLTTIRYIQQKWHALMLFENNGTLLKRQMKNTPSEIDKYDTHTHTHTHTHAQTHKHTHKMIPILQQRHTPCDKGPECYLPRTELSAF